MLWAGAGATVGVAIFCALAALLGSQGCGSMDGSFHIDDPAARPSGFCQGSHFPGFPDSLGSTLLVGLMYLTPVLVVGLGTIIAAARDDRDVFRTSFAVAGLLVAVVVIVSVALAHVGYSSPV